MGIFPGKPKPNAGRPAPRRRAFFKILHRGILYRGLALVALKDFGGGIASLQQAAAMHPADSQVAARIQLGLVEAYLGDGRRQEARQALEQAVKMGAPEEAVEPLRARLGP